MKVVEKYLNKRFISDSAASIKDRGGHYLKSRMKKDMLEYPEFTRVTYKCDIKKFYQSINQEVLIKVLNRYFKDKKLIKILTNAITMLPSGISIGLRTSQALGNMLLDYVIDHIIKDREGCRFYRRYCDDIVIQCKDMYSVTKYVKIIKENLNKIGLVIKGNEQVFYTKDRGVDFLGYITYNNGHTKIRKHIKKRFSERWKRVKSNKRRISLLGSFYGIAKHADTRNLFKK